MQELLSAKRWMRHLRRWIILFTYIKPGSAGAPQTVPLIATLPATTAYKTAVLAAYDAGTTAKKLEYNHDSKMDKQDREPGR